MKVTLTTPRRGVFTSEVDVLDRVVLAALYLGADVQDIKPGAFLGLPAPGLALVLAKLMGLGYVASAEGIEKPAPQPHVWSEDIRRIGEAKARAERKHAQLSEIPEALPGPTRRTPFGLPQSVPLQK